MTYIINLIFVIEFYSVILFIFKQSQIQIIKTATTLKGLTLNK